MIFCLGIVLLYSNLVPIFLFFFLTATTLFMFFLALCQFLYSRKPAVISGSPKNVAESPFVSIHIAICNEPSQMVIDTLKHALKIDYPNYEIIVLDNNTTDKTLWKPVAKFCKLYSEKIKFRHFDELSGYKAGALNQCLNITHPNTEFIFTLDADYQVESACLTTALAEVGSGNLAMVQFPQFYFSKFDNKRGILKDLDHFFSLYASAGNKTFSTLPTGTLSFIRLKALRKVGGWPETTLTEDARLGLELLKENFKTSFSNKCIGRGILPGTLKDLKKQRNRWAYGNTQCLMELRKLKMARKGKFSAFIQLTAWLNCLSIPLISMALYVLLSFLGQESAFTILPYFVLIQFGIFILGKAILLFQKTRKKSFNADFRGFLVHLALSFEMAFAFWPALFSGTKKFSRTNKFKVVSGFSGFPVFIPLLLLVFSFLLEYQGKEFLAISCSSLFALFLVAGSYIVYEFRPTSEEKLKIKSPQYENSITSPQ